MVSFSRSLEVAVVGPMCDKQYKGISCICILLYLSAVDLYTGFNLIEFFTSVQRKGNHNPNPNPNSTQIPTLTPTLTLMPTQGQTLTSALALTPVPDTNPNPNPYPRPNPNPNPSPNPTLTISQTLIPGQTLTPTLVPAQSLTPGPTLTPDGDPNPKSSPNLPINKVTNMHTYLCSPDAFMLLCSMFFFLSKMVHDQDFPKLADLTVQW